MFPSTPGFISRHITHRSGSLFADDLARYHAELSAAIDGKSLLVIGGAGTIGSSFVRAALRYRPARLYVCDINENGLTELTRDLRSSLGFNIPEDYRTYPVNFGDPVFEKILKNEGPFDIVANFAAHKHVRSEKDTIPWMIISFDIKNCQLPQIIYIPAGRNFIAHFKNPGALRLTSEPLLEFLT